MSVSSSPSTSVGDPEPDAASGAPPPTARPDLGRSRLLRYRAVGLPVVSLLVFLVAWYLAAASGA